MSDMTYMGLQLEELRDELLFLAIDQVLYARGLVETDDARITYTEGNTKELALAAFDVDLGACCAEMRRRRLLH